MRRCFHCHSALWDAAKKKAEERAMPLGLFIRTAIEFSIGGGDSMAKKKVKKDKKKKQVY
jgi:hypothetical protein